MEKEPNPKLQMMERKRWAVERISLWACRAVAACYAEKESVVENRALEGTSLVEGSCLMESELSLLQSQDEAEVQETVESTCGRTFSWGSKGNSWIQTSTTEMNSGFDRPEFAVSGVIGSWANCPSLPRSETLAAPVENWTLPAISLYEEDQQSVGTEVKAKSITCIVCGDCFFPTSNALGRHFPVTPATQWGYNLELQEGREITGFKLSVDSKALGMHRRQSMKWRQLRQTVDRCPTRAQYQYKSQGR